MARQTMLSDQQISEQAQNRQLAESAIAAAGYTASRFDSNKNLEVYFDIAADGRDVGFIAKGWTDPGFRIGELVPIPRGTLEDSEPPEYLREFCATNGVALSRLLDPEATDWLLDYVIYSSGFNAETLRESLTTLSECKERIEQDFRCRFVEALFGSWTPRGNPPLQA